MKLEPYKIEKLAKYYDEIAEGYVSSEAGSQAREQFFHMHKTFMKFAETCGVWDDIEKVVKQMEAK
tara:strand:- start:21 stop:218 length:198 start_codon:yes stop_codon:yes gene_type:complete